MNVRLSSKQKIQILNAQEIFKIMQQVLLREDKIRRNQEHFWVIGLNNQNKILFIELVSLGAANRVHVAPPEVFRIAIYKLAVRLILVHNHPSGTLDLSSADQDFTARMIKSGELIKIEVLDHLIITEENYTSFAAKGIIEKLKYTSHHELMDREKAMLQEIQLEVERKKEREIAKRMKEEGYSIDAIQKITKLKKSEINKL